MQQLSLSPLDASYTAAMVNNQVVKRLQAKA